MLTVCNGKIDNSGRCEKCYEVSQTTSGYCTRLIEISQDASELSDNPSKERQIIEVLKKHITLEYYTEFIHGEPHTRSRMVGFEEAASELSDNPSKERQIIEKQDELIMELSRQSCNVPSSSGERLLRKKISALKSELSEPERDCENCYEPIPCNLECESKDKQPDPLAELEEMINTPSTDEEKKEIREVLNTNKTAEEILEKYSNFCYEPKLKSVLVYLKKDIIEAMHEFASQFQAQPIASELNDIIKCILAFDKTESLETKGRYFEVIQRDLSKL